MSVERKLVDCPKCDGEGCIDVAVTGGRWSSAMGQWYPAERTETCSLCEGRMVIPEFEAEEWKAGPSWR